MAIEIEGQVGEKLLAEGANETFRQSKTGEICTTDTHARFYEAASRGKLFGGGMTTTTIAAATYTTATLGATCTPIIGLYNPTGSGKNFVVMQAKAIPVNTALQTTGAGALMWCTSIGNGALTLGTNPLNLLTLQATGSVGKDMSGIALTGLTNNLVVRFASGLGSGPMNNTSFLQTAVGALSPQVPNVDNVDGSIIVPPGGVLALLSTTQAVAISIASSLIWEEVTIV